MIDYIPGRFYPINIKEVCHYQINDLAEIVSPKGKVLSHYKMTNGYMGVWLYYNTTYKRTYQVSRLMLKTFDPIKNDQYYQVHHGKLGRLNDSLKNLEWKSLRDHIDEHSKNKCQLLLRELISKYGEEYIEKMLRNFEHLRLLQPDTY